jgi:HK97 family phage major capsid protein
MYLITKKTNTMTSLTDLRHEYQNIREQMRDMVQRAKKENRDLNGEENANFLKMHDRQEELQRSIDARAIISGMDSESRASGLITEIPALPPVSYRDAFDQWVRRGEKHMGAQHAAALAAGELRGTSTITTETTGGIFGGYVVPTELSPDFIQTMKAYGGMMTAGRLIRTSGGGTFNQPYIDDTSTASLLTAEASATTVQDLTFSRIQLSSYTYRSAVIVSREWLQDEAVNAAGEINSMLATRMGRALNTAFTTGDGSGKPTGILASSGGAPTGKTTTSATAMTATEILDLVHSVDPAYRTGPNVAFMLNDSTLAYIKKLQLGSSDSTPLWVNSMRDGAPATIWGYPYVINQDFESIATNKSIMAFGDWSYYLMREVLGTTFVRTDELYLNNFSVGFYAFARYDGKLIPVGAIKRMKTA